MTRLIWHEPGARTYETGVDHGVVYPHGSPAEAWDGLISVKPSPLGGDPNAFFLDGEKYALTSMPEEFTASVECFIYPEVIDDTIFDLSYRTRVVTDENTEGYAHILHFVYNAMSSVAETTNQTLDDDPELEPIKFDISVKPERIPGIRNTAHLYADLRYLNHYQIADLEALIYGGSDSEPHLPSAADLVNWFSEYRVLVVIDNGDGTWTATGPDDVVFDNGDGTWTIDWPSAIWLDEETWQLSSF